MERYRIDWCDRNYGYDEQHVTGTYYIHANSREEAITAGKEKFSGQYPEDNPNDYDWDAWKQPERKDNFMSNSDLMDMLMGKDE